MTEITECRWRCDYCGVVSPVLDFKPATTGVFQAMGPKGWVFIPRGECGIVYLMHDYHFCCAMHKTLWKQQRAESAETPEEAKE